MVVAETDAPEAEALDLVPAITSAVLEEHHLIVGVVMLVDASSPIPINSRGEKQVVMIYSGHINSIKIIFSANASEGFLPQGPT